MINGNGIALEVKKFKSLQGTGSSPNKRSCMPSPARLFPLLYVTGGCILSGDKFGRSPIASITCVGVNAAEIPLL